MRPRKDRDNLRNAIVGYTQPKNKLEDGRGQNDEVSTPVWQSKNKRGRKEEKEKEGSNPRERENRQVGNR